MINYITSEIYRIMKHKSFYVINFLGILFVIAMAFANSFSNFEDFLYVTLFLSILILPLIVFAYIDKSTGMEALIESYRFNKTTLVMGDFFAANTLLALLYIFYFLFIYGLGILTFDTMGEGNYLAETFIMYMLCTSLNGMLIGLNYVLNKAFSIALTFLFLFVTGMSIDVSMINLQVLKFFYYHSPFITFDRLMIENLSPGVIVLNLMLNFILYSGLFLGMGIFIYNRREK